MEYLHEEQYYIDLYDLFTIKECLRLEGSSTSTDLIETKDKKLTSEKSIVKKLVADILIYFAKGERYKDKSQKIREWIENDKRSQEKYNNTSEPKNISCLECGKPMPVSYKMLEGYGDKPLRMLFFFVCRLCKKQREIYENGEERHRKPIVCTRCSGEIDTVYKRDGRIITTTRKCRSCGFIETETDDLDDDSWEKEREKDKKLLEKYRSKFCLDEKEGNEYISFKIGMDQMTNIIKEQKEREKHKDVYDKVKKLKKLTVTELEKLLSKVLEKENYLKLELSNPEIDRHVIVKFTVRDSKKGRSEYDSRNNLRKIINKTLFKTNWRLMSEGIAYRLGLVYGRLKAYENEEDLVKLVGGIKEKPIIETDEGYIY